MILLLLEAKINAEQRNRLLPFPSFQQLPVDKQLEGKVIHVTCDCRNQEVLTSYATKLRRMSSRLKTKSRIKTFTKMEPKLMMLLLKSTEARKVGHFIVRQASKCTNH